jgi:hypothetical protein
MMRLFQSLSIIAVALALSLTCTEANLRATVAEQPHNAVRSLSASGDSTEDDDYAPDSGSKGMGKGGNGTEFM